MVIVKQELKKMGAKDLIYVKLYADEAPANLSITGEDIGIAGDILPGSMLLTPSAQYIYGEQGKFSPVEW